MTLTNAGAVFLEVYTAEPVEVDSPLVTFAAHNNVAACNRRLLWFATIAAVSCLRTQGKGWIELGDSYGAHEC